MSTVLALLVVAWVLLVAVAFVTACIQAVVHLLPPLHGQWQAPMAPTLAEEART